MTGNYAYGDTAGIALGGALHIGSCNAYIQNSTLHDNTVGAPTAQGGAIYNAGALILTTFTIANNAISGNGVGLYVHSTGTVNMSNVTITGNEADTGAAGDPANPPSGANDCLGTLSSEGFNIVGDLGYNVNDAPPGRVVDN